MGPGGYIRCLDLVMGAMPGAQWVQNGRVSGFSFSLKSPFLFGVKLHVLGLQCHQHGCDFWLEWSIWINGTWGIYKMSRFGDGGNARCSMGPKRSLDSVFLA